MIKRLICVVLGITSLGLGIGLTIYSTLGSDPLATFVTNLSYLGNVSYNVAYIFVNLIFFLFMFLYLKDKINIGTILSLFLLGFLTDLFSKLLFNLPISIEVTSSIVFKISMAVIGILLSTFGIALYGEGNLGLSPYDCFPLVLNRMNRSIKYVTGKMSLDLLLVLFSIVLYFINKTIGHSYYLPQVITLVSFVVYGPLISFFSIIINYTIFRGQKRILK